MATEAQLRLLVQDPETGGVLDSTAYALILDMESNLYRAAAIAARAIAASFATKVSLKAGPITIEAQQKFEHYTSLADDYDQRAREGGGNGSSGEISENAAAVLTGISIDAIDSNNEDTDRYASVFKRGMDDNPLGDVEGEDY